MSIAFIQPGGSTPFAGVFVPRTNLKGLTGDWELADNAPTNTRLSKFLASFLTTISDVLIANRANPTQQATGIGINVVKGNPAGIGRGRFSQTFTATWAMLVNNQSNGIEVIPVPTKGSNNGKGRLTVKDIFFDAITLNAGGTAPTQGVLISHSELNFFGADDQTGITDDGSSRKWYGAMFRFLIEAIPVREPGIQSAVVRKELSGVEEFGFPAAAFDNNNPSTNLNFTLINKYDLYQRSSVFTVEYILNEDNQTFEILIG